MEEAQISQKKHFLIGDGKVPESDKRIAIDKNLGEIVTGFDH